MKPLEITSRQKASADQSSGRRIHFIIILFFILLSPIHTLSLVPHLSTHVAGDSMDTAEFLLNEWWTAHALLDLKTNPFYTTYSFYPLGQNLLYHTYNFLDGLAYALLRPWVPLILFHNLLLWMTFFLNSLAAYLLLFHLTRMPWLAFIGATAFSHSPTLISYYKIPCLLELYSLVFFIFTSWKLMENLKPRWALYAGILLGLTLYSYPYYFIFGVIWLAILITYTISPWHFMESPENKFRPPAWSSGIIYFIWLLLVLLPVFSPRPAWEFLSAGGFIFWIYIFGLVLTMVIAGVRLKEWRVWIESFPIRWSPLSPKKTLTILLLGAGVLLMAALTGAPYVVTFLTESGSNASLESRLADFSTFNVDWVSFFAPFNPFLETLYTTIASDWKTGRPIVATPAFLGYGFIILLVMGMRRFLQRPDLRFWLLAFMVFLILSLGPFLKIHGVIYHHLVLPGYLTMKMPILGSARTVSRYLAPLMLVTSIIACLVVKPFLQKVRPGIRGLLLLGFFLLIGFEYGLLPYPSQGKITDYRVPPVYQVLAQRAAGKAGVLLDLPLFTHSGLRSEGRGETKRLYFQTVHGQKMVGGVSSKLDEKVFVYFQNQPGVPAFWSAAPVKELELAAFVYRLDIDWIVLDKRRFTAENFSAYRQLFHKASYLHTFYEDQRHLGLSVDRSSKFLQAQASLFRGKASHD